MKTVFFSIDTKQASCCGEERQASGAPEGMRCIIIPGKTSPARPAPGKVLDFDACRRNLEQKQARTSKSRPSAPRPRRDRRRTALYLAADLCASAAVVAAAALVLIRFWML